MKELDILGDSKHTLALLTYFQGVKTPTPGVYAADGT